MYRLNKFRKLSDSQSKRQAVDRLVFNLNEGPPSASNELGWQGLCDLAMVELINHSLLVLVL